MSANPTHKCNVHGLNERDECVGEELIGGFVVPGLSGAIVQQKQGLLDLGWCHGIEVGALGEELAQQAVGVLVDPSLPGRIGCREVRLGLESSCDFLVLDEFSSVIEGERLHLVRQGRQQSDDGLLNRRRRILRHGGTEREQGFALDHGDQRTLPISAHERVTFPVSDSPLACHDRRACLNRSAIGDAGCPSSRPIALAPLLSGMTQVHA